MADIFISYVRSDASIAAKLARALERAGFSVWWDRNLHVGADFSAEIEREIAAAGGVVVLWSTSSRASQWVRDEAAYARDRGKLVPVNLDGSEPPLGFRQVQALDWQASAIDAIVAELTIAVRRVMLESEQAPTTSPLRRRSRIAPVPWLMGLAVLLVVGVGTVILALRPQTAVPSATAAQHATAVPAGKQTDSASSANAASCTTKVDNAPVSTLDDERLVDELACCTSTTGASINFAQYKLALHPTPEYVLSTPAANFYFTSSLISSSDPLISRNGDVVITSRVDTQYPYTDPNTFARDMNALGIALAPSRALECKRGLDVLAEVRSRIARRSEMVQMTIDHFIQANPNLKSKSKLIGSILPWVPREQPESPASDALEQSKRIALSLKRGKGVSGDWYGVFQQTLTKPDGQTASINQAIRVQLHQTSSQLTGEGDMGSGEQVKIAGTLSDGHLSGVLANTTNTFNVTFSGIAADDQLTVDFNGEGAGQKVGGSAAFFR